MTRKEEVFELQLKASEALGHMLGVVDALLIFRSCDLPLDPRIFRDLKDKRDAYLAATREVLDARLG